MRALLKYDAGRRVATWWNQDSNGRVVVTNEYDDATTKGVVDENQRIKNHRLHNPNAVGRLGARVPAFLYDQWQREYAKIREKDVTFETYCMIKASSRDFSKLKTVDNTGYERRSGRWSLKVK